MSIEMHNYCSFVFKMSLGQQKSVFLNLKPYKTSLKLLRKNRIIYIIYRIIGLSNRTISHNLHFLIAPYQKACPVDWSCSGQWHLSFSHSVIVNGSTNCTSEMPRQWWVVKQNKCKCASLHFKTLHDLTAPLPSKFSRLKVRSNIYSTCTRYWLFWRE